MISAQVLCDSIGPAQVRLTTFLLKFPRFLLAELNTHRSGSRNAASSRAIPAKKLREKILDDPALPVWWGSNNPGMQSEAEVQDKDAFKDWWLRGLEMMARHHAEGEAKGYHKQIVNRILEPWMMVEVIFTADQFGLANLFHQRRHKAAQPEFQALANAMWKAYQESTPQQLEKGEWHLPLITEQDREEAFFLADKLSEYAGTAYTNSTLEILKKVSVGRCARVSYLNHLGVRSLEDDIALHDKLLAPLKTGEPPHLSPFEHVAQAVDSNVQCGNVAGWWQYRKQIQGEWMTEMPRE